MAVYRLVCSFGHQALGARAEPVWVAVAALSLADEAGKCLTDKVYLPTIVSGRVLWHLGYSASKARRPSPRPMACFNALPLRTSPRTRCGVP
jgi:hypothetical protein